MLLLVDNVSSHPRVIEGVPTWLDIQFLPKNTTSLIQPMDQGVIMSTKAMYTRTLSNKLANEYLDNGVEALTSFWKYYTETEACDLFVESWGLLKESTARNAWNKLRRGSIERRPSNDGVSDSDETSSSDDGHESSVRSPISVAASQGRCSFNTISLYLSGIEHEDSANNELIQATVANILSIRDVTGPLITNEIVQQIVAPRSHLLIPEVLASYIESNPGDAPTGVPDMSDDAPAQGE